MSDISQEHVVVGARVRPMNAREVRIVGDCVICR